MRRRGSYSEQRESRKRLFKVIGTVLILIFVHQSVSALLVQTRAIGSRSMAPGLVPGDLVLASTLAYGGRIELLGLRLPGAREPERGDVVVLETPWRERPALPVLMADSLLRFVSFQRLGLLGRSAGLADLAVKRIIAVPGDRVYLEDGVFRVKTPGAAHFLTEFEVSGRVYELGSTKPPEGWPSDFPLSPEQPEVLLGAAQYYVAGDDRAASADSRAWGPIPRDRLLARVIFRYWPFRRSGAL